jgi:WD40 repeat protein
MACNPSTSTIAVGTELANHQASILLWDLRGARPAPKAAYHDLHSDDITQLAFHPSPAQAQLLLSGSTDGLVSVHDTSVADEDELTVQTLNLNASIHRAAFIGGAQAQATSLVGALSHDERFAVYDVGEDRSSGDAVRDFGDLRAVLGCQYVADVVPKADGTGAILGAGSQEYVWPSHSHLTIFTDRSLFTAKPCSSSCFYREPQQEPGSWIRSPLLDCPALTARRLSGLSVFSTKSRRSLQQGRMAWSRHGGQEDSISRKRPKTNKKKAKRGAKIPKNDTPSTKLVVLIFYLEIQKRLVIVALPPSFLEQADLVLI